MNLAVLIGSCDAYFPLWEPFQVCFNKYWSHKTNNVFVTETLDVPQYAETKFNIIKVKGNWGSRMLKGIDFIKEDYIFFILEDYLFNYEYSKEFLENSIRLCDKYNIDRLQISPSGHQTYQEEQVDGLNKFSPSSQYLISMQPSIWKKEFLYKTLLPECSPWDFELIGSQLISKLDNNIFIDKKIPSVYFNAVRRGMIKSPGFDQFFEKENLKKTF